LGSQSKATPAIVGNGQVNWWFLGAGLLASSGLLGAERYLNVKSRRQAA
jgi:hypothetical protein